MVKERYETERLILRRFTKDDAQRTFNSWNNPQNYRYNEIPRANKILDDGTLFTGVDAISVMSEYSWPNDSGLYFFVAETKDNHELIGTCRLGKWYYAKDNEKIWDFGYNIFRSDDKGQYSIDEIKKAFEPNGLIADKKYWGKGYSSEILKQLINIACDEKIDKLVGETDILNLGSAKVMIKNGLQFTYVNPHDGGCNFEIDLTKNDITSKDEIEKRWADYLKQVDIYSQKYHKVIQSNNAKHFVQAISIYDENQNINSEFKKLFGGKKQ